jgi:hypothetical protein
VTFTTRTNTTGGIGMTNNAANAGNVSFEFVNTNYGEAITIWENGWQHASMAVVMDTASWQVDGIRMINNVPFANSGCSIMLRGTGTSPHLRAINADNATEVFSLARDGTVNTTGGYQVNGVSIGTPPFLPLAGGTMNAAASISMSGTLDILNSTYPMQWQRGGDAVWRWELPPGSADIRNLGSNNVPLQLSSSGAITVQTQVNAGTFRATTAVAAYQFNRSDDTTSWAFTQGIGQLWITNTSVGNNSIMFTPAGGISLPGTVNNLTITNGDAGAVLNYTPTSLGVTLPSAFRVDNSGAINCTKIALLETWPFGGYPQIRIVSDNAFGCGMTMQRGPAGNFFSLGTDGSSFTIGSQGYTAPTTAENPIYISWNGDVAINNATINLSPAGITSLKAQLGIP